MTERHYDFAETPERVRQHVNKYQKQVITKGCACETLVAAENLLNHYIQEGAEDPIYQEWCFVHSPDIAAMALAMYKVVELTQIEKDIMSLSWRTLLESLKPVSESPNIHPTSRLTVRAIVRFMEELRGPDKPDMETLCGDLVRDISSAYRRG